MTFLSTLVCATIICALRPAPAQPRATGEAGQVPVSRPSEQPELLPGSRSTPAEAPGAAGASAPHTTVPAQEPSAPWQAALTQNRSAQSDAAADVPKRPLSTNQAISTAAADNPALKIAVLQVARAQANQEAEAGLYATVATANAAFARLRAPNLQSSGVIVTTTNTVDVGAGLSKPFITGTRVDVGLAGQRSLRSVPILPTGPDAVVLGPGYSLDGQISVTHPLLRGSGSELGAASLRTATLDRQSAALAARQSASLLLRDVLNAYWELWYTEQVERINEASRELAATQAAQAEAQVRLGALAGIDTLVFNTRLAELEEAVLLASAERQSRSLTMALLLGDSQATTTFETLDSPATASPASSDESYWLKAAARASPRLKQLETLIKRAEEQFKVAGDPLRPRLDVNARLRVRGLGNREVPPAFEQFGTLEAVSAEVGLSFEAPLDDSRRQAQLSSALFTQRITQTELRVAQQELANGVVGALTARRTALERMRVSRDTVQIARAQAEAERRRLAAGASIAIQVQQAEDSLRQAELRLERARVDSILAHTDLEHFSGELLERYRPLLGF